MYNIFPTLRILRHQRLQMHSKQKRDQREDKTRNWKDDPPCWTTLYEIIKHLQMYHDYFSDFLRLGRFENLNLKLSWMIWMGPTQFQPPNKPTQPGHHSESSISQAQSWRKALEVLEMCLGVGRLWENGDVGFGFKIWRWWIWVEFLDVLQRCVQLWARVYSQVKGSLLARNWMKLKGLAMGCNMSAAHESPTTAWPGRQLTPREWRLPSNLPLMCLLTRLATTRGLWSRKCLQGSFHGQQLLYLFRRWMMQWIAAWN